MTKTFTEQDLIRYLFHETTEKEEQAIHRALSSDSSLKAIYNNLIAIKKKLDETRMEPSSTAILNILSYSKSVGIKK